MSPIKGWPPSLGWCTGSPVPARVEGVEGPRPDPVRSRPHSAPTTPQLGVGRFLPNMQQLALAVLHPRKLIVYSVVRQGGAAAAGDGSSDPLARQFNIKREYEHNIEPISYNFCTGPFGGV